MGRVYCGCFFFFKQKTAYEVLISDWSSDVCSSDLRGPLFRCTGRRIGGKGLFHPGGQYPLAAAGRGDDPVRSVLSRMADVPGGGRRMRRARPTVDRKSVV